MNDEILGTISASLTRIEGTLDGFTGQFAQHIVEDKETAQVVAALARRQRGFFTVLTAAGVAIGAGMVYVVKRLIGSH
jgi:hypothetical protein